MRLVGIRTGRRVDVAVQVGDRVTAVAEVTDFDAVPRISAAGMIVPA